jgi:hypothetical protein
MFYCGDPDFGTEIAPCVDFYTQNKIYQCVILMEGSAYEYLVNCDLIKEILDSFRPECLPIDPLQSSNKKTK